LLQGAPYQNSYTIVKNNFKNIPMGGPGRDVPLWVASSGNGGFAPARPEQFFFEGGLNDAGF
jgi:hypothetical protein